MTKSERALALMHIEHLRSLPSFSREPLIFDRGYASFDLIQAMAHDKPVTFLFRLRTKFDVKIDRLPVGDHPFTLVQGKDSCEVRVVKFKLSTGETETLLTNLQDDGLTLDDFKELYFKRWPVETKYYELKHKLEAENFSGRTRNAILQDFFITAFLSNIVAIGVNQAQQAADTVRQDKENKYEYNINVNQAVGNFKDRYIQALIEEKPRKRAKKTTTLLKLLIASVVPLRPGRRIPRNPNPRKAHFHFNKKSNC